MFALNKKILITGNEAIAEAAVQAGCRFYAGYPITPQNEICAYMAMRMPEVGGTFIQSESEIAAINMVLGALVAGALAMTSSSSPGISLKQEGISYLAACQLPAVIVNMMRGGPGLGDIRPAQSDYFQATKGGGHGDYRLIVFAPSTVQEAFDLTYESFHLTQKYRIPLMILGDGILGQMMGPLQIKLGNGNKEFEQEYDKSYILTGCEGREPRSNRSLYLGEGELERWNANLQDKYSRIQKELPRVELIDVDDAELILIAYGSTSRICKAVVSEARKKNFKVGVIRPITLWPYPYDIINQYSIDKKILVVEMSAGQMLEDVRLAVDHTAEVFFHGRTGGGIPEEHKILDAIKGILS